MSISRRNLISSAAALGASAIPIALTAQPPSSLRDPQIATLNLEGRMPLTNILPSPAMVIPPDVLKAIQAGTLDNRGRVEYIPASRVFRIHQLFVTPQAPFPLPSTPKISDNSVGVALDMAIEQLHWSAWKAPDTGKDFLGVTISGRTITVMKGPAQLDEYGVLQFAFERDNPAKISMLSLSYTGAFVAWSTEVLGTLKLAPTKAVLSDFLHQPPGPPSRRPFSFSPIEANPTLSVAKSVDPASSRESHKPKKEIDFHDHFPQKHSSRRRLRSHHAHRRRSTTHCVHRRRTHAPNQHTAQHRSRRDGRRNSSRPSKAVRWKRAFISNTTLHPGTSAYSASQSRPKLPFPSPTSNNSPSAPLVWISTYPSNAFTGARPAPETNHKELSSP